jgi:hypothetical protein
VFAAHRSCLSRQIKRYKSEHIPSEDTSTIQTALKKTGSGKPKNSTTQNFII